MGSVCRFATAGGDIEGEDMCGGELGKEPGMDDGGEDIGEVVTSAHAALLSGKKAPAEVVHELFPDVFSSLSSSGVVAVLGLGLADEALARTSGGSMENILSSAGGGPYVSNGSGTACSIGSITGSDLSQADK